MTPAYITNINDIKDAFLRGSFAAMQRAAQRARDVAIQTNTAMIMCENGQIKKITADELRKQSWWQQRPEKWNFSFIFSL